MKLKVLLNAFVFTLLGALMLSQLNTNNVLAVDGDPLTAPITDPTPTPSPSPEPSSEPITGPITEPSPTPTPEPSSTPTPPTNSPVSSSGGSSQPQPPVCGDSKPTSTPRLISAISNQPNQVTLVWSKANDPVTYYLISYGLEAGKPIYGNPNVGGKETTIYVVKELSGQTTYYFRVRAGNGCMSGEYSNELAVKVVGSKLNSIKAEGFEAGVLSTQTESAEAKTNEEIQATDEPKFQPITSAQPLRSVGGIGNFFSKILNFFLHLFGR